MLPIPNPFKERKPGKNLEEHQQKNKQKLQREFRRKSRDITIYLAESLRDFSKAQNRQKKRQLKHPIGLKIGR